MSDPNTTDLPDLFLVPEFHSTPWVRKPTVCFGRVTFVARILSAEGNTVVDVTSVDDSVATAKAACIVAAVNQHAALLAEVATLKAHSEALLKALESVAGYALTVRRSGQQTIEWCDDLMERATAAGKIFDEVKAAIKLAEGEKKP